MTLYDWPNPVDLGKDIAQTYPHANTTTALLIQRDYVWKRAATNPQCDIQNKELFISDVILLGDLPNDEVEDFVGRGTKWWCPKEEIDSAYSNSEAERWRLGVAEGGNDLGDGGGGCKFNMPMFVRYEQLLRYSCQHLQALGRQPLHPRFMNMFAIVFCWCAAYEEWYILNALWSNLLFRLVHKWRHQKGVGESEATAKDLAVEDREGRGFSK